MGKLPLEPRILDIGTIPRNSVHRQILVNLLSPALTWVGAGSLASLHIILCRLGGSWSSPRGKRLFSPYPLARPSLPYGAAQVCSSMLAQHCYKCAIRQPGGCGLAQGLMLIHEPKLFLPSLCPFFPPSPTPKPV